MSALATSIYKAKNFSRRIFVIYITLQIYKLYGWHFESKVEYSVSFSQWNVLLFKIAALCPLVKVDGPLELPLQCRLREHSEQRTSITSGAKLEGLEGRPHEELLQEVGVQMNAQDILQSLDVVVRLPGPFVGAERFLRTDGLHGADIVPCFRPAANYARQLT